MSISEAAAWDDIAEAYEGSFESLTLQYARPALKALRARPHDPATPNFWILPRGPAVWLWEAIPQISPVSAMLLEGLSTNDLTCLQDAYTSTARSRHGSGPFVLSSSAHIITGCKPEQPNKHLPA